MEPVDDVGRGQKEGWIGVTIFNMELPMNTHVLRLALLILPATLSLYSCKDSGTQPPPSFGNFEYTAFDSSGTPVVHGALDLIRKDSAAITGTWELEAVGSPQNIGPQVGRGSLEGWINHDRTVHLNLNPGWADNNVFLSGKLEEGFIHGTWSWSTIVGETSRGTFVARKL